MSRRSRGWETRKNFFKNFCEEIKKTQEKIKNKKKYRIEYQIKETKNQKEYIKRLFETTKKEKTNHGPHKDVIRYYQNNSSIKEKASQGEKKLFIYLLKLTEAEYLKEEKKENPILLFDDFTAKLDNENIMKIFIYFHCKFQTIITTTKEENLALPRIFKKSQEGSIKIIDLHDKIE